MFTLRKISETGYEHNFILGNHYTLRLKDRDAEFFTKEFKEQVDAFGDELYGVVIGDNCNIHCLFVKQKNYIMTGNGQTYTNLTQML
jgi:hypothetical protein